MSVGPIPPKSCVLYGYRGSIAHNLYLPDDHEMSTDDVDLMGVCIAPVSHYVGIHNFYDDLRRELKGQGSSDGTEYKRGSEDVVLYDIRKFVRLLTKQNPNVLFFLWNQEDMYLKVGDAGQQLLENRDLFRSLFSYDSFVGYARSQLKKMFAGTFQGYMGEKRKAIVRKYGYDTKNASHLIRLLKTGLEFISTGQITVYRTTDREELLDIKCGKWSRGRIEREANKLFGEIDRAQADSPLPAVVDKVAVNNLLQAIMVNHFDIRKESPCQ